MRKSCVVLVEYMCATHVKLLGGIDLLVDVFLRLKVDGLEGGLWQRVSMGIIRGAGQLDAP